MELTFTCIDNEQIQPMFSCYGNTPNFIPASQSKAIVRCGYAVARLIAHSRYKLSVDISTDDLDRLRVVSRGRSILMPNHPTPHDWLSMYLLSARLSLPFHYMTAHEQFTGNRRYWLPRFGAYSIRRGCWGDIRSITETLRILRYPHSHLVMFPEGRCTFSSCDVFGFKAGAVKIGFNYLQRYGVARGQDLFLVPVSIRYQYLESVGSKLEQRIDRLECHLGTRSTGSPCNRLVTLTRFLVADLEHSYGLTTPRKGTSWRRRIELLGNAIMSASEHAAGLHTVLRNGIMNRACNIRQFLAVHGSRHGIAGKKAYVAAYYPTLLVLILDTIGELDLSEPLSLTMQADLLYSLERVVYRMADPVPVGRRRAVIRIDESMNLAHWYSDFCEDRSGVTAHIVSELHKRVERGLSMTANTGVLRTVTNQRPADRVSRG